MKYCKNCGVELQDNINFCPNCGTSQTTEEKIANEIDDQKEIIPENDSTDKVYVIPESSTLGIVSIICCFFIPALALCLGLAGMTTYKKKENRQLSKIALIISFVMVGITIIQFLAMAVFRAFLK